MSTKPTYKSLLKKVSAMRSAAASAVFERATILCQVFADREFRADAGNLDDLKAAELLDGYVDDLALNFLQLRAMLASFPDAADWASRGLRSLHEETLARSYATREERAPRTHKRTTRKELEEITVAKQHVQAQLSHVQKMLDEKQDREQKLLTRIRDLEQQLAKAEGRIAELERIVNRELQAA